MENYRFARRECKIKRENKKHTIEAVIDRIIIKPDIEVG